MRKNGIGIVTLALLIAGTATASAAPVQTMSFTPKMSKNGKFTIKLISRYYDSTGEKPPSPLFFRFRLPNGTKINRSKFPVCKAETLRKTAGFGCKKSAQIGSATAEADLRPLYDESIPATAKIYNGPKPKSKNGIATVVMAGRAKLAENLEVMQVFEAEIVKDRVGPYGSSFFMETTIEPWEGIEVSIPEIKAKVGKMVTKKKVLKKRRGGKIRKVIKRRRYNWAEPPKKCAGEWAFKAEIGYEGGSDWEKELNIPCRSLVRR